MDSGKVILFENENGKPSVEISLVKNTLWLSQKQMSQLFDKNSDTIGFHLKNIYSSEELNKKATTEDFSVLRKEGNRKVRRTVTYYNLDAIISVGYRVNSKKGTQFRIWATNTLKEHLTQGYSINEKRLEQLQKTIQLIHRTSKVTSETKDLLEILSDYSSALDILDKFDHQSLTKNNVNHFVSYKIEYKEAKSAIDKLKIKFGGSSLFGNEKDESFKSSISTIDQTLITKNYIQVSMKKPPIFCILL